MATKKTEKVTPKKKAAGASTLKAGPRKAAPPVQFKSPTNDAAPAKRAKKAAAPTKAVKTTKQVAKKPQKKAAPASVPTQRTGREYDEHGFVIGSDSSRIASIMLEGGESRSEINEKIATALAGPTRYGNDKNVSSLVSGLLGRLKEKGYTVESSWRLVPPSSNGSQKPAKVLTGSGTTPKAKRPAKKASSAKTKGSRK